MGVFNFMETSFIISLGITFVLILLLIYHFKQRLTLTESKQETMFEIINNLAQELNNIKGHVSMISRPSTPYPFNNLNTDIQFSHEHVQQNDEPDEESEESDNEDDEDDERIIVSDDEDDDEDDEDDDDNDDISVEELTDDDNEHKSIEVKDVNENTEPQENIHDIIHQTETINNDPNFSKMNLGSLKEYIVQKGLVKDASKMKKAQILTLIQDQQPAI